MNHDQKATERLSGDPKGIASAADILRAGGLVAFPTETVYGLGADATNGQAVACIYEAKDRPQFNPLIVHVPDLQSARQIADIPPELDPVLAFWPGPLTLVAPLKADAGIASLVTAGLPNVAIRVPDHPLTQKLLTTVGAPIAAPSANRSGSLSPTTSAHVSQSLDGRIDAILEGGATQVGLESTIIGLEGAQPVLLRAGGIPQEALAQALGAQIMKADEHTIRAPGQLASHYAPDCPIRLNAEKAAPDERFLGFGANAPAGALNLSANADLHEAAANLFAHLHTLNAQNPKAIAVAPIPQTGIGRAINDRLARAAAPKP